jgi:hypothetical protein
MVPDCLVDGRIPPGEIAQILEKSVQKRKAVAIHSSPGNRSVEDWGSPDAQWSRMHRSALLPNPFCVDSLFLRGTSGCYAWQQAAGKPNPHWS